MVDIDELMGRLNPKTAKMFKRGSEIENRFLETPSLGINMAIGGIGYGRQTTLYGNRSGGKSLFCLGLAAKAQSDNEGVAWIDAEKNFDPQWAERNGADPSQMMISPITSIADMADAAYDMVSAGFGLIVVDSISALLPESYFDNGEMKDLSKTGQIGTFSKNMGSAVNMLNNVNDKAAIVLISQVRNAIGSYGATITPMGGKAVDHMNSTQIKLWSNPSDKEAVKGKVQNGNLIIEKPIARPVAWTIEKNRGPGMHETGKYDLYFRGDFVGIDYCGEVFDLSVNRGLIAKKGAWFTIGDESIQGRPSAVQHLRNNPDIIEELREQIA